MLLSFHLIIGSFNSCNINMSVTSVGFGCLSSCQASDIDFQCPHDNFWSSKILDINVKATFIVASFGTITKRIVKEESHMVRLDDLARKDDDDDWHDTNVWDVFDSMQIPIQRSMVDKIVGYALDMAAGECYKNRKVLRMQVEVETLVNDDGGEDQYQQLNNFEELDDVYSIDVEADDFWETVEAFRKLRKKAVVEEEDEPKHNLCSICLVEFLVGSEVSATPCSHVFHDRCIRAWLKKCKGQKFCPNCVTPLA